MHRAGLLQELQARHRQLGLHVSESSIRFEQTFNAVREHFQGMFRKLFGGGKADIYLETELEQAPEGEFHPEAMARHRDVFRNAMSTIFEGGQKR